MKRIHITNGEIFNHWIKSQMNETFIPFNEAMMSYSTEGHLFDEFFCQHRAYCHGISVDVYTQKIKPFLDVVENLDEIDELVLWFGQDAFCQMNLLTILSVLEDRNYTGLVQTVLFDENKDWKEVLHLQRRQRNISGSTSLFQKVLIEHHRVICDDEIMDHGIELYLDYLSDAGKLTKMIHHHPEMSEDELIVLLLKESEEYGLSDVQAKDLIRKVRDTR